MSLKTPFPGWCSSNPTTILARSTRSLEPAAAVRWIRRKTFHHLGSSLSVRFKCELYIEFHYSLCPDCCYVSQTCSCSVENLVFTSIFSEVFAKTRSNERLCSLATTDKDQRTTRVKASSFRSECHQEFQGKIVHQRYRAIGSVLYLRWSVNSLLLFLDIEWMRSVSLLWSLFWIIPIQSDDLSSFGILSYQIVRAIHDEKRSPIDDNRQLRLELDHKWDRFNLGSRRSCIVRLGISL